jgi:hypothetical protein
MVTGGDGGDDGRVLSPDELDIEEQDEVAAIGDDRYVIGADGEPEASGDSDADPATQPEPTGDGQAEVTTDPEQAEPADPQITGRDVKEWLAEELESHDSDYAYHIAAKYGDDITHQQMATDDVGAAFDGLLVWYARQVAGSTPVDEALGILLGESSVQIRYPTARLIAFLEHNDLGPDDSIRDLVDTVSSQDGLVLPRQR